MKHPEEKMILYCDEENMMMLSIKRKLIVKECGGQADIVDLCKE